MIWSERTPLAYSTAEGVDYSKVHLTCRSDSSAETGQCPSQDTHENGAGAGYIHVLMRERRSGLTTQISAVGWIERAYSTRGCFPSFWEDVRRPVWTSHHLDCSGVIPNGTGAYLAISAIELERLVAGRWDGQLILDLRTQTGAAPVATYTYTFELTITDHANASIYFPLFDHVTPHVGLNIDYIPTGTPTIGGSAVLDMCLYDGLGSQSQYLEVTISDDGRPAPGRLPGMYSVWRKEGMGDESDRLDYEIKMDYDGSTITMENTRVERLSGVDTSRLRLVVLPTMTQPVYCVPTPLELHTPRVSASSKAEGYYEGRLRIEMNMPVSSP